MNTDIRLKTALRHHRKIKRLVNRLGAVAPWNLIQLWLSASENRPEGILTGYTIEDIADDADWQGDPNVFVSALLECKWLDKLEDGTYALHDWAEHQPYVVHSEDRSEQARHAAKTRWAKRGACSNDAHLCSEHAGSIQAACGQHADSNADFEMSNAPSPSPDPSPTPKPRRFLEEGEISDPKEDPPPNPPPVTGGGGERGGFPLPTQSKRKQPKPEPPEFAEFYAAYPRKVARSTALKAWLRIRPDPADVMEGLARWIRVWDSRGEEGRRFIPYPATFLNQERWKECEESDGRRGRSITEHWDSHVDGRWDATNPKWGGRTPTDEELDSVIEQTFGTLRNPPVRPGVGNA